MSCKELEAASQSASTDLFIALIERDAAMEKAELAAEAAAWACVGEVGVGMLGGAVAGAGLGAGIGGAAGLVACIAGLKAAESAAVDAQQATEKADVIDSRASDAFLKYMICTFHCRDYDEDS